MFQTFTSSNNMRKKRILFCSEATFLNTGYATYTREILNYLHSTGKYEIAELASYGEKNDIKAKNIPWKFYGVMPSKDDGQEEKERYASNPINQFGEFRFEEACIDFKPDFVCDIRDFWMLSFAERSPFRKYFKWIIMPTVDAYPQAREWIATYQSADACLTYSDWAGKVLKEQSGGKINYLGSSPPSAHPAYKPIENKILLKSSYLIDPDTKIIGTVMRNQRRKLYPDLFCAFKKFLSKVDNVNEYYLYCHTSYPDLGWDIPELLHQYELSSRVLFTYVCNDTGKPFPSLFKGAIAQSPFTGKYSATIANVKNGLKYEDLAKIINMFDLYVQYANCEGFGLPQVEAAACGIPVAGTDYSAMESVLRQLDGIPIKPRALYKELETGCMRAVPDNELAANIFKEFFDKPEEIRKRIGFNTRQQFLKHFQWDKSGKMWEDYFDSQDIIPEEQSWKSPPRIKKPANKLSNTENMKHQDLARWLIVEVLGEPDMINSFLEAKITRDLMYQSATGSVGGLYFNESSAAFDGKVTRSPFNFDIAYDNMVNIANKRNYWEYTRTKSIK
jgi:glycosyltransferase involved in cell wall biosynthesis